jgi:hypothetical protein
MGLIGTPEGRVPDGTVSRRAPLLLEGLAATGVVVEGLGVALGIGVGEKLGEFAGTGDMGVDVGVIGAGPWEGGGPRCGSFVGFSGRSRPGGAGVGRFTESMILGTWGYWARPTATREASSSARGAGFILSAL